MLIDDHSDNSVIERMGVLRRLFWVISRVLSGVLSWVISTQKGILGAIFKFKVQKLSLMPTHGFWISGTMTIRMAEMMKVVMFTGCQLNNCLCVHIRLLLLLRVRDQCGTLIQQAVWPVELSSASERCYLRMKSKKRNFLTSKNSLFHFPLIEPP